MAITLTVVEKECAWSENRYWTISPVRFQPIRKADVPISPIIPRYFYFDILRTPIRENVRINDMKKSHCPPICWSKKVLAPLFYLRKKVVAPLFSRWKNDLPPYFFLKKCFCPPFFSQKKFLPPFFFLKKRFLPPFFFSKKVSAPCR